MVDTFKDWGKSQDQLAESFGLAPVPPPPSKFSPYIAPRELPRSHLVGSGPELNNIIVMTIHTGELPPQPQESNPPPAPRHYWRSLTYDRYTGSGWISNPVDERFYDAGVPLIDVNPAGFQKLQQDVHILENVGGQLFWSGAISSVNQPLEAAWRSRPVRSIPHDPFQGMDLLGVLGTGTTYTAYSLEAHLTNAELRASNGPYPEGMQRYLSLPDTVPERVLTLARDLTADKSTSYDRALAIESYLRDTYPYTLNVPAPPLGRDVADFFLFDLRKGYCDYYATALAVLARAAGLPARFVSGYSSGTYDPEKAEYVITEANAHSWAEIFFTDVGWVEFEPTAGLPAIDRSGVAAYNAQAPIQSTGSDSSTPVSSQRSWTSLLGAVLIFITVAGFLIASYLWLESLWLLLMPPQARIEKVFDRMVRNGNRLGSAISAETPFEFSDRMIANLGKPSINSSVFIKPAHKEVRRITDAYVLSAYSHHLIPSNVSSNIVHMWRKLRVRLWWGRLILAIPKKDRLRGEGKG
jgi:transglutaminase-like putative cysteine protease